MSILRVPRWRLDPAFQQQIAPGAMVAPAQPIPGGQWACGDCGGLCTVEPYLCDTEVQRLACQNMACGRVDFRLLDVERTLGVSLA